MDYKRLPVPLLFAGLAALAIAQFITEAVPDAVFWTDAQALPYQQAAADLHNATYGARHSHKPGEAHFHDTDEVALAEAKARYQAERAKLERAQSRRNYPYYALLGLGVLLCTIGLGCYFTQLSREDSDSPQRR